MGSTYEESFFSDLLLKKEDGTILIIKSLAQLQQKIVFKEVMSNDLFSKNGKDWEELNQIEQLAPFFKLIELKPDTVTEEKIAAEAAEKERAAKLEQERTIAEVAEKARIAKLEAEKKAEAEAAEKERIAKLEKEKKDAEEAAEKERAAKLEQERTIAEIAEKVRIAKLEAEKKVKVIKKNDNDEEFDKSFFDDEDIPKKKTGLKVFITILILSCICAAIYFFYFRNVDEKRIVAVLEEPVQIKNEEPAQVVEKVAETKPEEKVEAIEKPEEKVPENEPVVKKEPSPKKQESLGALCKRGWQTLDKGEHKKAIEIFRKALSIKSSHPDAHLGLGESLNAAGNKNEAKKHYQKYLELSPDAEDRLEIEAILNNL